MALLLDTKLYVKRNQSKQVPNHLLETHPTATAQTTLPSLLAFNLDATIVYLCEPSLQLEADPLAKTRRYKSHVSHYPQRFKIKKSRFSYVVNTQGKRRIVPILEVIDLQNSNTFFDTLPPVLFIYVALTRFSTSLLGSEADHTYRGRT